MATGRNGTWIWKVVELAAVLLLAGLAAMTGYGRLGEKIENNCLDDGKVHPQVSILDTRVTRVEENVKSINQNVAEQKTMQQQILNKQDQILWELQRQ